MSQSGLSTSIKYGCGPWRVKTGCYSKSCSTTADFRTAFGEPGAADAVSTFLNLPEGYGYEAKLLVGIWKNRALAGALDCIMGYPSPRDWTVGLLVVADRDRGSGIATSVLQWVETVALERGAESVRGTIRRTNDRGTLFAAHRGYAITDAPPLSPDT
jgi:GNAT superfamily N-acetyltransferase